MYTFANIFQIEYAPGYTNMKGMKIIILEHYRHAIEKARETDTLSVRDGLSLSYPDSHLCNLGTDSLKQMVRWASMSGTIPNQASRSAPASSRGYAARYSKLQNSMTCIPIGLVRTI